MKLEDVTHSFRKRLSRVAALPLFRFVAEAVLWRKYGRPVRIRRRDGLWYHYCPDWTLVDTRILTSSRVQIDAMTTDEWLFDCALKPGDVVIDVGAGVGWEIHLFSRLVGPSGRVIAVEAHPRTFRCLESMVRENRLPNVTCVNVAVGSQTGDVFMTDREAHITNAVTPAETGLRVECVTMDGLVERLGLDRVDLLKMNIEGAERDALVGMRATLRRVRHAAIGCHDFLTRFTKTTDCQTKAFVTDTLREAGFSLRTREDDGRPWVRDTVYRRSCEGGDRGEGIAEGRTRGVSV